ncbi:MAG: hypothetical protein HYT07_00035 [Candidatus Levybacteria bacterium]|nr:hypothetical protein [Candidatus Levybacteria bacterium]
MTLEIKTLDPLKILTTTKSVVEKAQFVHLNEDGLEQISMRVEKRLAQGLGTAEEGFGATGDFVTDVQLIFLQEATNFCF